MSSCRAKGLNNHDKSSSILECVKVQVEGNIRSEAAILVPKVTNILYQVCIWWF